MNKNYKGFSLAWVIGIVVVTSIISALTTGVIIFNNYKITKNISYSDLSKDKDLEQFLNVYSEILSDYYEDVDKKELLEKAIAGMMNYLGDDYSSYLNDDTTAKLLDDLSGEYEGIGVYIDRTSKMITEVFDNTPASKAGIVAGDLIIGVNNRDTTDLSTDEIVDLIKKEKSEFTLNIKRNEEILNITLKREKIITSIDGHMIEDTNIGYLAIKTFSANLDTQVKEKLEALEKTGMTSLIIDLRNDTGGYLDAATKVASMFLEKDKKIYSLNYKNEITAYKDETKEKRSYPIVVLVNENTASASEILAAALKESYGATLIGKTTFGKGKVQQTKQLESGGMVKYTSAYWLTPAGSCIDKVGIKPDYMIENSEVINEDGTNTIIDKQLDQAIDILKGE